MKCCARCIGDRHLEKEMVPNLSTEMGKCSYCGSEDQPLVEPLVLRDAFELVIGIYKEDDSGAPLGHWLRSDWAMFEHPAMDAAHVKELLGDILDDGEAARRPYLPSDEYQSDALDQWKAFRLELMHTNRFFPESGIDLDRLGELLPHLLLGLGEIPKIWFRARIQKDGKAYSEKEMGAPPKRLVGHGRANPAGIPYLYVASGITTAVAEVRPHTGDKVSVAEFAVPADPKIIDLAAPRRTVSPFVLEDESKVGLLRADIGFLEQLGEELARPILPNAAAVDYTPSQYLCEFVKTCGFHGVRYKSSAGSDTNLALFKPSLAKIGSIEVHDVTRVSVEHKVS